MNSSIHLNSFEDKIELYHKIISNVNTTEKFKIYPEHWGLSYAIPDPSSSNSSTQFSVNYTQQFTDEGISVSTIRLDDLVQEDVFILKIDVEGYELKALAGAKQLLENHQVEHLFFEWDKVSKVAQAVDMLNWLHDLGYSVYALPHEAYDDPVDDWNVFVWQNEATLVPPSAFAQVTASNLWLHKKLP